MKLSQRKQKTYSVDVHGGGEFDDVPTRARFVITRSKAEEILRLSQVVKVSHCHSIESFDYSVDYQTKDDLRTDLNMLHVSATAFHFSANVKHTDIQFSTEPVQLKDLSKFFGLDENAPTKMPRAKNMKRSVSARVTIIKHKTSKDGIKAGREPITQEDITDLMTDLRHFCKQNQLSFAHSHRISEEQYLAEISGKGK